MTGHKSGYSPDIPLILEEVAGLDGESMRGTDNAALASVLGALNDAGADGAVTDADTAMAYIKQVVGNSNKIDSSLTSGLLGTSNSLAYRVHEIEKHFHNIERWHGKSADQSGNDWALEDSLTPYTAISGASVYGADANDEAKVFGTDDLPTIDGNVKFDIHRVLIVSLSVDTPYIFRLVYGTGTMGEAIIAGQYSTFMAQNNPAGSKAGGFPVEVMMPRITTLYKIWMQIKCATDNATATFFVGEHGYVG